MQPFNRFCRVLLIGKFDVHIADHVIAQVLAHLQVFELAELVQLLKNFLIEFLKLVTTKKRMQSGNRVISFGTFVYSLLPPPGPGARPAVKDLRPLWHRLRKGSTHDYSRHTPNIGHQDNVHNNIINLNRTTRVTHLPHVRDKHGLRKRRPVVLPTATVSMPTCSNFEVERAVHLNANINASAMINPKHTTYALVRRLDYLVLFSSVDPREVLCAAARAWISPAIRHCCNVRWLAKWRLSWQKCT